MFGVAVLRVLLLPVDNFETVDTEEGAREFLDVVVVVVVVVIAWPGLYCEREREIGGGKLPRIQKIKK